MPDPGTAKEAALAVSETERHIDYVVDRIVANVETICQAHVSLGIPLDDVLCSLVRRALNHRSADEHQPTLFTDKEMTSVPTDQ